MPTGEFAMRFCEWDFLPIIVRDELAGVAMVLGPDIHVAIEPKWQKCAGYWRDGLKKTLQPIIDTHGHARTLAFKDDAKCLRFLRKLGFVVDSEEGQIVTMKITKIRLIKEKSSCQQS